MMKKYKKAALLSAFLFPGAGHLLLKKYISGGIIMGISAMAIYVVVTHAITRAIHISEQILAGEIAPDVHIIMNALTLQVSDADAQTLDRATILFISLWAISIIDTYRVGR
jgi:TM2 domain-containing membrane protein YozV